MRTSVIFAFALLLSACGVARPVLDRDNTTTEVKTVVELVHDTTTVELPVYVERVATMDTASRLENKFAVSEARVSGGVLQHTLETKAVKLPVPVESKIVYRDSLVYRDRVQTRTVEVERPLTGWQKAKLRVGGICFFVIIIYGINLILHFIYKPNLFKL